MAEGTSRGDDEVGLASASSRSAGARRIEVGATGRKSWADRLCAEHERSEGDAQGIAGGDGMVAVDARIHARRVGSESGGLALFEDRTSRFEGDSRGLGEVYAGEVRSVSRIACHGEKPVARRGLG